MKGWSVIPRHDGRWIQQRLPGEAKRLERFGATGTDVSSRTLRREVSIVLMNTGETPASLDATGGEWQDFLLAHRLTVNARHTPTHTNTM
jgi:hypothetical protein